MSQGGVLSWAPRVNITKQVAVTPTISTSAYVSGYQLGGIMTLAGVVRQDSNTVGVSQAELHSVTILDQSGQNAAIDIQFFSVSPTLTNAGDHTAYSISGANLVALTGNIPAGQAAISVGTTYSSSAAASISTDGINLSKNIVVPFTSATPNSIYAVAVVRGTPTYTSTTALTFIFNFYVD